MTKIERIQTGVRMEKRLLKVLKGLAEYLDLSLGELLEGMTLHAFEGKAPFSRETLKKIDHLKAVYDLQLSAVECHARSEEHTSDLQSLMRISYAVFCLKKKIIIVTS